MFCPFCNTQFYLILALLAYCRLLQNILSSSCRNQISKCLFVKNLIPLACEQADDLWLKHVLKIDEHGDNTGELRDVFLLPSRWDPRVTDSTGMPVLGAGLMARLRLAGWHDVVFGDLDEYGRFRSLLAAGTLASPAADASLLDWYASISMRFPRVSRAARFVLTIPFSNTNVSLV